MLTLKLIHVSISGHMKTLGPDDAYLQEISMQVKSDYKKEYFDKVLLSLPPAMSPTSVFKKRWAIFY